ncbi:helix-turn-helix transcriptional regulator [Nocardia sp. NPDC051030]|uniref:helix-turn-helix domain-containing protein n=1 Tax=Nocardia sp. NPDC051030 TaxID=3155162 RepID=UPI00343E81D4
MANTGSVPTTLLRRRIGRAFKLLREQAGKTLDDAAEDLDRGRATIGRIEQGAETVRFREADVRAMLDLYKAPDELRQQLLALTAETRNGNKPWWHDYTKTALPEHMRLFIAMENAAEFIRKYEQEVIPGLLQTRRYAETVLDTPRGYATEEEAAMRVQLRMDRQSVLSKPRAPRLEAILSEAAIRRTVGGPEIMAEQIEHLLTASQQNNISIRVMPFDVGIHGGAVAGAFSLMDFPPDLEGDVPIEDPLVYADTITGALYLDKPDEVAAYRQVWQDMVERALTDDQTRELLHTVLKGLQK